MTKQSAKPPKTLRQDLDQELKKALDESEWNWLSPHLARDALIVVSNTLDLLGVAEKVALDDKVQVGEWVASGLLAKPTVQQIENWTKTPQKKFLTLIVQPFVLIQEHLMN